MDQVEDHWRQAQLAEIRDNRDKPASAEQVAHSPVGPAADIKRVVTRLEELRHDLHATNRLQQTAADTLLSMLWVALGQARLLISCVLCGYTVQRGMDSAPPPGPVRLCARLDRMQPDNEPLALPGLTDLAGAALAERIGHAVVDTLTHSLDTLHAVLRSSAPDGPHIREEAEVCLAMLSVARRLRSEGAVEPCLRLLHLFSPELTRSHGPQAMITSRIRESTARTLSALSPDVLFAFWYSVGGPDARIRRNLLQVLDYLTDSRAVPYLIRLLERRTQWADGDMVGWFVVRAMEHIGDRSALPALRRISAGRAAPMQRTQVAESGKQAAGSAELGREAERVILAIEGRKNRRESASLLRPSQIEPTDLLRPVSEALEYTDVQDREELLRPDNS